MDTPTVVRKRFTTDEFVRLAATGFLGEDERFELLEGEIVEMSPLGPRHSSCLVGLTEFFYSLRNPGITIRVQDTVRLGDFSAPQPGLAIVNRRDDRYASAHPEPEDVLLLIEVSDSSLTYDRDVKLPLYARAGIAEVWLVAVQLQIIEVYRMPSESGYGEKRTLRRGESIAPAFSPSTQLLVEQVF